MCRFDVAVWPPWLCLCPPVIKIIDEEAQSGHLRLCGSVFGFMFMPDEGLKHTETIYFVRVCVWLSYPKSLPIQRTWF